MWESILFLHFQRQKKKKKVDAARFLDARGDEKQVINLEWPNMHTKKPNMSTMHRVGNV